MLAAFFQPYCAADRISNQGLPDPPGPPLPSHSRASYSPRQRYAQLRACLRKVRLQLVRRTWYTVGKCELTPTAHRIL